MSVDTMLKGTEVFGTLGVKAVDRISGFSSVKEYRKGESIFKHEQGTSHVYVLLEGLVYLQLPANPPDFNFVISKVEKGELFGLSPLLDSPRYTSTARCHSNVKVLAVEAEPFRELLKDEPAAGSAVMSKVAGIYFARYINVLQRLEDVVGKIALTK